MIESLGDDKIDAINWVQDRFGLLRNIAEDVVVDFIKTGKIIISENGVFLTEDEEEFDENIKKSAKNISQKKSQYRYHNKSKRMTNKKMSNKMSSTNNGDDAANDMLNASNEDDEN